MLLVNFADIIVFIIVCLEVEVPKIVNSFTADGLTEIAGQDNDGQPNLQGLTLQDRKMTDKLAGPDIVEQDNDGQTSRA